jgi:hypothetical protein
MALKSQRMYTDKKTGEFVSYRPDEDEYQAYDKNGRPLNRSETMKIMKHVSSSMREHHAQNGFHGFVNKPTRFIVGEGGVQKVNVFPRGTKGYNEHLHPKHHNKKPRHMFDVDHYFNGGW